MVKMNRLLHIGRSQKGQQLVEFALILPVIILCLGVIITAGQLLYGKMVCQMAAYEGARKAVVTPPSADPKSVAIEKAKDIISKNGISLSFVGVDWKPDMWKKGNLLDFAVTGSVRTLFPIPDTNFKFHTDVPVKGQIRMMIENDGT